MACLRRRSGFASSPTAPIKLAREWSFALADLEQFFHGHGIASTEPWFVQVIEPNLGGATALAEHWRELLTS
jgi:hypothetical protein